MDTMALYDKPLFIFEMANNHQGDGEHGKNIIAELQKVSEPYKGQFDFAVKFQYRNLDTFIHKDFRSRNDVKNVKRFLETRLSAEQFKKLRSEVEQQGFYAICTPFDEDSVDLLVEHQYDVIKIASCSFTDWPLLEKIALVNRPVIASAAGSSLDDIKRVVNFFQNRKIGFSLMHCVAEYPTASKNLQMNQIDLYRREFPGLRIGFSTHESPEDTEPVKVAAAKGAMIFEKHVGLPTATAALNGYSASPHQVSAWLKAASDTFAMCGIRGKRYSPSSKESDDLTALQRGVFAKRILAVGDKLNRDDYYLAFPCRPGQLLASRLSKYNFMKVKSSSIEPDAPILLSNVEITGDMAKSQRVVANVLDLIHKSGVVVPLDSTCEFSHHYGMDEFYKVGVTIINCINREYCKKILVVLPGQRNPEHVHKLKEETFTVLYGKLTITCGDVVTTMKKGESKVVERGVPHSFSSDVGCVFEEISTTHNKADSFYGDESTDFVNPRKTEVYITKELLEILGK